MPRRLPFAVDTWGPSSRRRRHRFLTHAHRDHLVAAADSGECPGAVYATRLTLDLALRHFPRVKLPPRLAEADSVPVWWWWVPC